MVHALLQTAPLLLQCSPHVSSSSLLYRGKPGKIVMKCCAEQSMSNKPVTKHVLSGFAASLVLLSQINQAVASEVYFQRNTYELANAAEKTVTLPLDKGSDEGAERLMMMRGMTANNFDPIRYSGRWYEVASLKRGFAGQGQEDCHCTQGVYTFDSEKRAIQVDTFCVHGSPDGYITGIRGNVQCLSEKDLEKNESDLEMQEMIKEKCFLRFPTLPFIPKLPYDVIATDYDNFALVSGAKDTGFIQIYSRTPTPGPEFIEKYKSYLANFGYDPTKIKDTPQDCEVMSDSRLAAMMSMSGMQKILTNEFPDLELKRPVQFDPFTSVFDTLKKLVQLYFK
ncbi:chloroplastic lipocalin isoform X1 [Rosa chinensis]|uniref:chloroplastic lipocalin isoform X1 n=1 Tax=Rosa chinensis TaxID=74649 RepID=UPI001AD912A5|nr:chloroplastic lipocalin isoform X1 [Rosa chinensis]